MNKRLSLEDLENLALGKVISIADRKQKNLITYISFDEEALTFFNEEDILLNEENRNKNYTPLFKNDAISFGSVIAKKFNNKETPLSLNSYQRLKNSNFKDDSVKQLTTNHHNSISNFYKELMNNLINYKPENTYDNIVSWFKSYILQYHEVPLENKHEILEVINERIEDLTPEQLKYLLVTFMLHPYQPEFKG